MKKLKEELINNKISFNIFSNELIIKDQDVKNIITNDGGSYQLEIKNYKSLEEFESEIILQTETDKIEELIKYILESIY